MGNVLVIKNANYSNVSVEQLVFIDRQTVFPDWVEGYKVNPATGEASKQSTQKACRVNIPNFATKVVVRSCTSLSGGIAFFSDSEATQFISGFGSEDNELHTLNIPENAVCFKYSYTKDSRATELGIPIVSSIDFLV